MGGNIFIQTNDCRNLLVPVALFAEVTKLNLLFGLPSSFDRKFLAGVFFLLVKVDNALGTSTQFLPDEVFFAAMENHGLMRFWTITSDKQRRRTNNWLTRVDESCNLLCHRLHWRFVLYLLRLWRGNLILNWVLGFKCILFLKGLIIQQKFILKALGL